MLAADLIPGGRAAGMRPEMFDPWQLAYGTQVEMEHTRDMALAREIAMDHLAEDPDYYRKLRSFHLDAAEECSVLDVECRARHGVKGYITGAFFLAGLGLVVGLGAMALAARRR